jgi:hypothetical protein
MDNANFVQIIANHKIINRNAQQILASQTNTSIDGDIALLVNLDGSLMLLNKAVWKEVQTHLLNKPLLNQ